MIYKKIFKKIFAYIRHPQKIILRTLVKYDFSFLSDETYLKTVYWLYFGKPLDLKDPQTFNAKLQWLKLYDRRPEYITMVDKYAVKEWVADRIGREYIIPTLGVWEHFDDIDFDQLPDRFALKCTHDSGGGCACSG